MVFKRTEKEKMNKEKTDTLTTLLTKIIEVKVWQLGIVFIIGVILGVLLK